MSERARLPPRPALPMTLWALVSALACERLVLRWAPEGQALIVVGGVVIAVALALAAALVALGASSVVPTLAVVAAAVTASLAAGGVELARQGALASALASSPVSTWGFEVAAEMSEGASGWRGRARALAGGATAGEVWLVSGERLPLGSRVGCVGRFEPNEGDEWGVSSRMQGIAGTVRVVRVLESRPAEGLVGAVLSLRAAVLESFDVGSSETRALLAGSVCGSAAAVAACGLDDVFATGGVSHLVAVSGGHLVVVCAFVGAALERTGMGPRSRAVALLVVTAGFVAFCGAPASAVRSWAMSLAAALSGMVGRRAHPASSAALVALLMALLEPGVTGQLGYLLSVACVCGICVFGGYARYVTTLLLPAPSLPLWAPRRVRRAALLALGGARDALALTMVSQVVTLPLVCPVFSRVSLVAPLANVALSGPFSALLALGLVAAALFWAPLPQAVALGLCDAVGDVFLCVLRALASLPMASVAVSVDEGPALAGLVAVCAALLAFWPRVSRRSLAVAFGLALALGGAHVARWRLFAPACVRVLDVGQGDAILVTDGAAAVLVDTGPGDAVVSALARSHVFHLDAVVITHLHDDHTGGLDDVLDLVPVGCVVVASGVEAPVGEGVPVEEVSLGDRLVVGGFTLRVVSPEVPVDGTENEHSLELALSYGVEGEGPSLTALLTGDAEAPETAAAVRRGDVGDVDFLKVGHHGSAASVDAATAAALDPEVSVASAGEGNSFGHPTPECVDVLEGVGSLFLCTKDVGDVCVSPGESGPLVTCARPFPSSDLGSVS